MLFLVVLLCLQLLLVEITSRGKSEMACFFVVLEILIMNVNLPGNFVRKKVQKVQLGIRTMFVIQCEVKNERAETSI